MTALYDNKPIIVCSTGGFQTAAIHVVRLSGFPDLSFIGTLFSLDRGKIKSRFAHFGQLTDPAGNHLDDVILTFFPAPNSYTGENCLELSVHGNPLNVQRIIDLFLTNFDFRHALPGEFTFRALRNQKLTTSQVEGLDLFLNAHSPLMLDQGLSLLSGKLDELYQSLFIHFRELKSNVELAIDFSDDIGLEECDRRLSQSLKSFDSVLEELYLKTKSSDSALLSPYIALFGPTNAGKSTLFNYLLRDNRSIVSSTAGTTRDYISESLNLSSGNYKIIDTAGFRDTIDDIEIAGIAKGEQILKSSFFKISVIAFHQFDSEFAYKKFLDADLLIVSHLDGKALLSFPYKFNCPVIFANLLTGEFTSGPIEPLKSAGPIEPLKSAGPIEPLKSAGPIGPLKNTGPIEPLKNTGPVEALREYIFDLVNKKYLDAASRQPLLIERHVNVISSVYQKRLSSSVLTQCDFSDLGVLDQEIRLMERDVSLLVGVFAPDELLAHIFSNFCIGK